ncbi:methyltransferase domain-containing protein [Actinomadura roseirufa]|uniref:methyltransferase domain-containing protein n=1 Tax=Actinomadura roseirufa TaxID=2094049 RepID=UPI001041797F|nr:methyltransferase domain-containing protein [Actinomadura roseirufa]
MPCVWREWGSMTRVDRKWFIPDTVWVWGDEGWLVPLRRQDAPSDWAELCQSDDPIITQVDDGATDRGLEPTSSSSAPSLMQEMISMLDVEAGMKILEIGSGTGYNAALLAQLAGAENVTTVEVDPNVADHARSALHKADFPVTVVTGDGAFGYPEHAPYDRVIATASVRDIPYTWVAQCRDSGRILLPWGSNLDSGGVLLTLTVHNDGTAEGKLSEPVAFMRVREQRRKNVSWSDDEYEGNFTQTTTSHFPREVFEVSSTARFAVGTRLPELSPGKTKNRDGSHTYRISEYTSDSWASLTPGPHGKHIVRQQGARRLWDSLEAAYDWWLQAGRPEPDRFGITVTPEGQRIWLDSPDNDLPPL